MINGTHHNARDDTLPTQEELETPRSAAALLPWALDRIKAIGATKEGKTIMRLGKDRMTNTLTEEVLPIGIFAAQHFGANQTVEIQPKVGNQNYDAVVIGDSPIKYIEVTQAHEGELAHLRMVILDRDGGVGMFDEIKKSGTKRTNLVVEAEPRAKRHDKVLDDELTRILEAVQRKKNKQYPANTALVIPFEDFPALSDDRDIKLLDEAICARALPEARQFCWLGLVGWVKHFYKGYDLGR